MQILVSKLDERLHNGFNENVCPLALDVEEIISKMPKGIICAYSISDISTPKLLFELCGVRTSIVDWVLVISDEERLIEIADYAITSYSDYGDGIIIYMVDGSGIELVSKYA